MGFLGAFRALCALSATGIWALHFAFRMFICLLFTAAQQHIAYIGVGAVAAAAALLYSDLAKLKKGLISVFEVGGSFFLILCYHARYLQQIH